MKILGHGIDLVSVSRMREILERQGEAFRAKVFTPEERQYCERLADPAVHFAARFAAKEAFAKASGLGMMGSGALSNGVEVKHHSDGRPYLAFSEEVSKRLKSMGGKDHFVSITHDGDLAMVSVILVGEA